MSNDVSITLAQHDDLPVCLTLIPDMPAGEVAHLVARRGAEIVGVAAIDWQDRGELDGFLMDVHVVPWARRQGIGTALCAAASALAQDETAGLWTQAAHDRESAEARFLEHCGFAPARGYFFYHAAIADYRDFCARIAARVRVRRAAGIAILPLSAAPLDQVAWLITAHYASSPLAMLHVLRERAATDRLSRIAMRGDRVAGAVIVREQDEGGVTIDAWAIDPRDRRGAVSPLLLDATLVAATEAGFTRFDFHCDELTRDTMAVATVGAELRARHDRFYKAA